MRVALDRCARAPLLQTHANSHVSVHVVTHTHTRVVAHSAIKRRCCARDAAAQGLEGRTGVRADVRIDAFQPRTLSLSRSLLALSISLSSRASMASCLRCSCRNTAIALTQTDLACLAA